MNRQDLIKELVKRTGLKKCNVESYLHEYEKVIKEMLGKGETVHLHGFVEFGISSQRERIYYNNRTKESRKVTVKPKIYAHVSRKMNALINNMEVEDESE